MMSRQNLIAKSLKLLSVNISKHPCIPCGSHSTYFSYSNSSLLSSKKSQYFSQIESRYVTPIYVQTRSCSDKRVWQEEEVEDFSKPKVKLTFVTSTGDEATIEGRVGLTLMRVAIDNGINMCAACEGQLACTTCHIYVGDCVQKDPDAENPYLETNKTVEEEDLLDSAAYCKPNSRLSCQLKILEQCEHSRFGLPIGTNNYEVDKRKKKASNG